MISPLKALDGDVHVEHGLNRVIDMARVLSGAL